MKRNLLQRVLEGINVKVFFAFIFLYQIIFIFQGLDFADEGYYATFYQQIFIDPQSVMHNFMYWLTGIVGGTFVYLFPQSGLLGIRILGVMVTTATIILAYNLLKKYVNIYHLRLGLLLVTILISNDPKELNYDNLSMLLFVTSIVFLFNGLQENKLYKLFISGAFIGLNCFTRVTNVLGVSLILGIIYYGFINRPAIKLLLKQILFFLGGFLLMVFAILLFIKLINHYDSFINSVGIVLHMGTDEGSEHNIKSLLFSFLKKYYLSFCYFSILSVISIIAAWLCNMFQSKTKYNLKFLVTVLPYCFFLLVIFLTVIGKIRWVSLLFFFMGLSLTAAFLIIVNHNNKHVKLLAFIGILILFFYPAGSDEFVEMFSLWIIFPIAVDYFFSIKSIDNQMSISRLDNAKSITLNISELQVNSIKKLFIYSCIFTGLYYTYYYPYFDISNRINMHYSVENKYLKGIYTTKERSVAVNELLKESTKYLKKNDYTLAYDCIPMFHFLTETRPFIYNPWPAAYLSDAFRNKLYESLKERKKLPVVIMQKLNTLNSKWPLNTYEIYAENKENLTRNICMNDFLKHYQYRKVWENVAFEILLPGESSIP